MKNYHDLLKSKKIKLFNWGKYRWFEAFFALNFLSEKYGEEWIHDLAVMLKKQGADYSKAKRRWKRPRNKWRYDTHVVNLAMMLKEEAVCSPFFGDELKGKAEKLFDILSFYNGTPVGTFTGDECLSGLSPVQGTELCSVAEIMFSFETLYAYSGDEKWAQLLELAAFNAFPATVSDDMWTHQYDQLSNQIACEKLEKPIFRTNNGESHLFGLEPNFGCCTANFNQAFPKLALATFMRDGDLITNALPLPAEYESGGTRIALTTDYPFGKKLKYHIETDRDFTFRIRVPEKSEYRIKAGESRDIEITIDRKAELINRPNGLKTVKYGPLIFSLPIEYEKRMLEYTKDGVERKFPFCDYELIPKSEWQFALAGNKFEVSEISVGDIPFSSAEPPLTITAHCRRINWGFEKGYTSVCAKIPESTAPQGEREKIAFYPYGCSKLRITELPFSD